MRPFVRADPASLECTVYYGRELSTGVARSDQGYFCGANKAARDSEEDFVFVSRGFFHVRSLVSNKP